MSDTDIRTIIKDGVKDDCSEQITDIDVSELAPTDLKKPFDATNYSPLDAFDEDSLERKQAAEANRFYGFLRAEDTPDNRVEAALEYQDMKRELENSNPPDIKRKYNTGGSQ